MKKYSVSWSYKMLDFPSTAKNIALLENGAKAFASVCEKGFSADGVINGEKTLRNWGEGNGWKSPPITWHPSWWGEWVKVDFPDEKEIDTIVVYHYPQMIIGRPWNSLLHYQVQYLNENHEWITITTVRHNEIDINFLSFEKVNALSIRIWANRNHYREESGFEQSIAGVDEALRFLEIEAYCLNGKQVYREYTGQKEIVWGEKGSAAIFYDETFDQNPRVDIAKLSRWLEKWGYGINILTADDLCRSEVFCAENFSMFVHPYGAYFPIGSNLYDFLMGGGHLLTFGGRAFTAGKQKLGNEWIDISIDPQITVSGARYIDYFRAYRDQLGIFTVPGSRLEQVNKVVSRKDQMISRHCVKAEASAEGWMALAMVGELQPLDETRLYVSEGRMPEINHLSREGVNRNKHDVPILWGDALDENYASVFAYACSRWIPLLDCFDSAGRNRGPALSLMPHYEGMYGGSSWIFCGVENIDVLQWENMEGFLHDTVDYLHTGIIAHSLEPYCACYHAGEIPAFSLIVDSSVNKSVNIEINIKVCSCGETQEILYSVKETLKLEPKGWKRLDFSCGERTLHDDMYKIVAVVSVDGKIIDCLENGFVVWNDVIIKKGPKVEFKNNFFHFDGKSRYVVGARDSGLHMPWQPESNALGWDREYRMLRDYGMQITSPVHMDWCFPGLGWGDFDSDHPIPEIILRRMDAQVQLAQKHNLIYAPCLFFVYEKIAMQKPKVARRICEVLGERYKDVPGIIFFIFDDGLRHDPDIFNTWAKECVDGFNACGREYMVTAEIGFRQIWPDAMRRSAKHLTFSSGSNFRTSVGDPVYERIIDLRPAGKSFTLGEFVRRIPLGTPEDLHGYLAPVHVNFGMGYAMSMNWKWSTPYHAIWPSDVIFPGNHVPKKHLYSYRNEALFFRVFEPVYRNAPFMLIMPSNYWLKNSESFTNYMVGLIRNLLEMKVDFSCIDEEDLEILPASTRGILLPMPLEFTQKAYKTVKDFVYNGGKAFVIGDLGKADSSLEGEGSLEWLDELCGISREGDAKTGKGRSLYMDRFMPRAKVILDGTVYEALTWINLKTSRAQAEFTDENDHPVVTKSILGKGAVWFMNDLNTRFPKEFISTFFKEAAIERVNINPNNPTLHCFETITADGPVYTMFTFPWDRSMQHVNLKLPEGEIALLMKDQSMCVFALTKDKSGVFALETQGDVSYGGREIVASNAHIMLAALDKKDILCSNALLLLPISTGTVKFNSSSDIIECGEFVDGKWNVYESIKCRNNNDVEILITDENVSKLFFVIPGKNREKAVVLLESIMLS